MSNCGPALLGMFGWDVAVSNFWLQKNVFDVFRQELYSWKKVLLHRVFLQVSYLRRIAVCFQPCLLRKSTTSCFRFTERRCIGKSSASDIVRYCKQDHNWIQLSFCKQYAVCGMRILLYFISACEEQVSAKCMIIFHIHSGYYPAKVHVVLLQFWRWCLLEVVFANGWVPLLIVVTRPSGGHCRQSWAILGRSRCQQSQLPPVTSFLLQNWKLMKYIYIIYIYIFLMIFFLVISFMFFFLVFLFADDSGSNSSEHWHERNP